MPTYLDSINSSLHKVMEADSSIYFLGEDILDPYGGAFKVASGLSTRFPERVLTAPISEAALVGIAGGLALRGLRPIVEIMFGDFLGLCMDQILNHIAKYRGMYDKHVDVPLVIRTPMGGGRGYGPTHSQSIEKHFLGVPGLAVVAPSRFHLPGALLEAAVADPGPVLFIEHKLLYPVKLIGPADPQPPLVVRAIDAQAYPMMSVTNHENGDPDVAIITYGGGSRNLDRLLKRLAAEEVRVSCVLPSRLDTFDIEAIAAVVGQAKHGCLIWEEGTRGFDWGAEVHSQLAGRRALCRGPVVRLASAATVIPAARHLEGAVILDENVVEEAIIQLVSQGLS